MNGADDMKRLWLSLVCALALGAVGCDGGNNTTDAGPRDGGRTDSGTPPVELPVVQAADGDTLVPADLSCLGMRSAPTAGAATDIPARTILRGLSDMARPSTTVRVFPGNQVVSSDTCDAPTCIEVTTDATGNGTLNLPADGWFAYQVVGEPSATPPTTNTSQVNVPAAPAASGVVELSVINRGLFESALGAANVMPQVGTSYFTGTARDCAGRPLVGAQIRVFGAGGEIVGGTNPRGARFVYWPDEGPFPGANEPYTSLQGRYAGGNIDPEETLRIELWAVTEEGAEPSLIACEEFGGQADQVTILNINPLRSDAPASCSE
jgi:hypothetical protein